MFEISVAFTRRIILLIANFIILPNPMRPGAGVRRRASPKHSAAEQRNEV
ncbi:MAG: hypothetical protein GXO75_08680 [Calditrichaeota bacterium]|nr:hypothetical protein [Calditrichota bacterium]